jgi:hypothetical protein
MGEGGRRRRRKKLKEQRKKARVNMDNSFRSEFKGQQLVSSCQGYHRTEIESTDFNETFASLKSQDVRRRRISAFKEQC